MPNRDGSRQVELLMPITVSTGSTIDTVTLNPWTYGDTEDWEDGRWTGPTGLLVHLSGLERDTLRKLKYPDVDRVNSGLLAQLPETVRDALLDGRVPVGNYHDKVAPGPVAPIVKPDLAAPPEPGGERPHPYTTDDPLAHLFPEVPDYIDPETLAGDTGEAEPPEQAGGVPGFNLEDGE